MELKRLDKKNVREQNKATGGRISKPGKMRPREEVPCGGAARQQLLVVGGKRPCYLSTPVCARSSLRVTR